MFPWHASTIRWINPCNCHHGYLIIFEGFASFPATLHSHYTISIDLYHLPASWNRKKKIFFTHKNQLTLWTSSLDKFSTVFVISHQCFPYIASDRMTLVLSVARYLRYKCYLLPKYKIYDYRKSYKTGNLTYWSCPVWVWVSLRVQDLRTPMHLGL